MRNFNETITMADETDTDILDELADMPDTDAEPTAEELGIDADPDQSETFEVVGETTATIDTDDDGNETVELAPVKVPASVRRQRAHDVFDDAVLEIENGVNPDIDAGIAAFSIVTPKGAAELDICTANAYQGWFGDPEKATQVATFGMALTTYVDLVKAGLPVKTTSTRVHDPIADAKESAQRLVTAISEMKSVAGLLNAQLEDACKVAGIDADDIEAGSTSDLPKKFNKALDVIEKIGETRSGDRSASRSTEMFVPGTEWTHSTRDGAVNTLLVNDEGKFIVNGKTTDVTSSSAAAQLVNGGSTVSGPTYWNPAETD